MIDPVRPHFLLGLRIKATSTSVPDLRRNGAADSVSRTVRHLATGGALQLEDTPALRPKMNSGLLDGRQLDFPSDDKQKSRPATMI
ncbi:MAG: hypothetical protein ACP5E5_12290 [Acidobacteriaceae bacterium]